MDKERDPPQTRREKKGGKGNNPSIYSAKHIRQMEALKAKQLPPQPQPPPQAKSH
jgi:hypothetical protein